MKLCALSIAKTASQKRTPAPCGPHTYRYQRRIFEGEEGMEDEEEETEEEPHHNREVGLTMDLALVT